MLLLWYCAQTEASADINACLTAVLKSREEILTDAQYLRALMARQFSDAAAGALSKSARSAVAKFLLHSV